MLQEDHAYTNSYDLFMRGEEITPQPFVLFYKSIKHYLLNKAETYNEYNLSKAIIEL